MTSWMLVEDESDLYLMMNEAFDIWGIQGIAFVDGEEAMSWIEAVDAGYITSALPVLALLDIRLPTRSGVEVGARLRRSPKLKNMVIVLITAYFLTPEHERTAIETAQADELIYKPLPEMQELRARLEAHLARRSALMTISVMPPQIIPPSAPFNPTPPTPTNN